MRVEDLDGSVLAAIVDVVCTPERTQRLARRHHWPPTAEVISAWRNFILRDHEVGRTYALHLIEHVDVHAERIVIVPKVRRWERSSRGSQRAHDARDRIPKENATS